MVRTRAQFKLDVRSQKDQSIYKNTNNSLTGASSASAGAIHYTTTTPPSNPMARGYKVRGSKGMMPLRTGYYKVKKIRHWKHRPGTKKKKNTAYCRRKYA
jgi:hypothetical protein